MTKKKLKTHKAATKRLRVTRTGKILARSGNSGQHLMARKKTSRVRRRAKNEFAIAHGDRKRIRKSQLLPYG